ncbi:MAG: hypothetical protein K6G81_00995 [Lachnospiraceae bacterium]|nr:hypothetical protein [Lachnospiraceae bacterium]
MKNFFKNLFGEKYPGRVNRDPKKPNADPKSMEGVYAGPEEIRNKRKPMGKVYAGPGYFENERKSMKCVYAGPEMMKKRTSRPSEMEDVYMGPPEEPEEYDEPEVCDEPDDDAPEACGEPDGDAPEAGKVSDGSDTNDGGTEPGSDPDPTARFNMVYAGSEYEKDKSTGFMGMTKEEALEAFIKQNPDRDPRIIAAVYAGPVQMNNQNIMLMAYAGPNMMNNGGMSLMQQFAQQVPQAPEPSAAGNGADSDLKEFKFCPCCGTKCFATAVFCQECGAPLKDVEVVHISDDEGNDVSQPQ